MATFNSLLAQDNDAEVWLLDVSFDDFATVAYRWSTASIRFSGNDYDGRIASVTPITRSFGRDNLPAASTTKLRISNSDFAADWLFDRTTVASQVLQARFRLTVVLLDGSDATVTASQVIGIFMCLNQPELMDAAIDLALADDSLGRLAEPLTTPTVRDWLASSSLIPYSAHTPVAAMDWDIPLPIVLGLGEFGLGAPGFAAVAYYEEIDSAVSRGTDLLTEASLVAGGTPAATFPIVVCASRAGNYNGAEGDVTRLFATYRKDIGGIRTDMRGATIEIPRRYRFFSSTAHNFVTIDIWKPKRSAAFTKSSRSWQVVYVDFNVDAYAVWFKQMFVQATQGTGQGTSIQGDPLPTAAGADAGAHVGQTKYRALFGAFASFSCLGTPFSVMSSMPAIGAEDTATQPSQRLVDYVFDLIAYYSKAQPSDMEPTAWDRARKARSSVWGAGIVQPGRPRPQAYEERNTWASPNPRDGIVGILRTALGELCGSCDADLFMTKGGLYSVATNVFDFAAVTGTRTSVVESRTKAVRVRTPSQGERWAPYNRVNLIGPGGAPFGPFDNQAAIDAWGKVLPREVQAKWLNVLPWGEGGAPAAATVWHYRALESKVRPAIRFQADREYLGLELGDYFTFTYSRGGASSVFNGTLFRLEGMRIDPATLAVELDAIWVDDLATDKPYLLDDENYLLRVQSTAGRILGVTDGDTQVSFSGGDLGADGVVAGDILVLKDATQADDVFTRYRALRITSVFTATDLLVDATDLNFDAPGGAVVATWEIRRGATTYPTSSSDPVNYPSGSSFYGKCCGSADTYSDASAANKLLDG